MDGYCVRVLSPRDPKEGFRVVTARSGTWSEKGVGSSVESPLNTGGVHVPRQREVSVGLRMGRPRQGSGLFVSRVIAPGDLG